MPRRTALRPIDLARMAGISTQQVRNYADSGLLPPTARSASGYRLLEPVHAHALVTYRALAIGFGIGTAGGVMRAVYASDQERALAQLDASHAALHEQRCSLRAAGEALEAIAHEESGVSGTAVRSSGLRIGEVAARLGVRASALRVWESAGLLHARREPVTRYRRFGTTDVRDARMITILRKSRYPLEQIREILEGLRATGSSEALRAALTQREAELDRRARAMLSGSSRLHHYLRDPHRIPTDP